MGEENESTALAVVETTTITLGVSTMAIENNLALWDVLLTSRRGKSKEETSPVAVDDEQDDHDASLIFFLVLAVLKKNSDTLLMLQGLELSAELVKVMTFQTTETETEVFVDGTADSGGCDDNDNCEIQEGGVYVQNWRAIALCMRETTPASVVEGLQSAEDEAFEQALEMRQRSMLLKMEKRLTIEAEDHMCAVEAERQRKEEVANYEMHKTRLEKFYTKYCPEKSGSEDRILKTYEGRLELLDQRLKKKYGTGFRPVISKIKSKLGTNTGGKDIDSDTDDEKMIVNGFSDVSVQVSCNDILPSLCGVVSNFTPNTTSRIDSSVTLKYFIVDCRSDERANTEGRFPTAKIMSPEVLMGPDRMQQLVDVLESFRGAIHICIMGEGYSSLPSLYNQDDDLLVDTLLEEDKSRTNNCALFFCQEGIPVHLYPRWRFFFSTFLAMSKGAGP